jgi:cytochrome P450
LRDEAPVYFDEPNGAYVITRYEDVSAVLRDHRRFSNRPLAQTTGEKDQMSPLREEDPPLHNARRRIVSPLFTSGRMRRQESYFQEVARGILAELEPDSEVEVSAQIAVPLAGRVTCDLLGLPLERHARFKELTAERLQLLHANDGRIEKSASQRSIAEVQADLWEIVGPVVADRRADPRDDAISLLVAAQGREGGDDVTEVMLINMLLHLLTGGFETTQHLVEMLLSLLADRPDLWQRLRADRSLIDAAVEEMLRWEAPVQALRRRPVQDAVIRGVDVPKDSAVIVVYGSANRDERVFPDPDSFDLDRDFTRHMAFSMGIHYCPGAPVSRYEVRALFEEMLDRYVAIDRCGPSEVWPQPDPKPTVEAMRGFQRVPVRLRAA